MDFQNIIEKINKFWIKFKEGKEKRSFRKNVNNRIKLYHYLIKGLESNLNLNIKSVLDARVAKHERVNRKKNVISRLLSKSGSAEMPFLLASLDKINKGESNTSIFEGGWITPNEEMLIKSNEDGSLSESLKLAIDLLTETNTIIKTVRMKLVYPFILLLVLFGMMYGFAYKFIPILTEMSDVNTWSTAQYALYALSTFLKENALILPVAVFGFISFISYTLPNWHGNIRHKFDYVIPYSMYKEFSASLFLISLSTMMKNNTTFINALENIKTNSKSYIKEQINTMLETAKKADKDNSSALNVHLLGEVGDDLEDLSRYGDFEQVLYEEGNDAIKTMIEKISKKTDIFKYLILAFVAGYVLWAFSSFMGIVQSVTENIR